MKSSVNSSMEKITHYTFTIISIQLKIMCNCDIISDKIVCQEIVKENSTILFAIIVIVPNFYCKSL